MKYFILLIFSFSTLHLYAQHKDIPVTTEFLITGEVKKEITFHIADITAMKQDFIGDVVLHGHKTDTGRQMKGVLLKDIIDSAGIKADGHKAYNSLVIILTASDGYMNVYSWNELFNTDIGDHVYVVTAMNGKTIDQMPDRIAVYSLSDAFTGRRHMIGLAKIEVRQLQ